MRDDLSDKDHEQITMLLGALNDRTARLFMDFPINSAVASQLPFDEREEMDDWAREIHGLIEQALELMSLDPPDWDVLP